jgi:peptidoglycan hydrolase-like protein with peptidoglycan-binding domain
LVRDVQNLLIKYGYLAAGEADGIFGSKTETALITFQKANGIEATGELDPAQLKYLRTGKLSPFEKLVYDWSTNVVSYAEFLSPTPSPTPIITPSKTPSATHGNISRLSVTQKPTASPVPTATPTSRQEPADSDVYQKGYSNGYRDAMEYYTEELEAAAKKEKDMDYNSKNSFASGMVTGGMLVYMFRRATRKKPKSR